MEELKCKNSQYYNPDYGIFTATGWTQDGSSGYCQVELKETRIKGDRIACFYFEGESHR